MGGGGRAQGIEVLNLHKFEQMDFISEQHD